MLNTVGYGVILLTEFAGGLKWIGVFEEASFDGKRAVRNMK
jgi:hypothetical protein